MIENAATGRQLFKKILAGKELKFKNKGRKKGEGKITII